MLQKGNALFLILIAVALFAALSYAVTQSGRGGSGIDKEQASINAAQIVQYVSSIEQAIVRLRLINGCSDTQISFHYDSDSDGNLETDGSDDYYNPFSPSDFSCHVFDALGGGLTFKVEDASVFGSECNTFTSGAPFCNNYVFTGSTPVLDVGTTQEDLLLLLTGLSETMCIELNRNLTGSPMIASSNTGGVFFEGSYTGIGVTLNAESGALNRCFLFNGNGGTQPYYIYYSTLLVR